MEASNKSAEMESIAEHIKTVLSGIDQTTIKDYSQRLFPILTSSRIYETLYISLYTFYSIKISKHTSTQLITNEAISLSQDFGIQFKNKVELLLRGSFIDSLLDKITNGKKSFPKETSYSESKRKEMSKQEKKSRGISSEEIDVDTNNNKDIQHNNSIFTKQVNTKTRYKNQRTKNINSQINAQTENVLNIGWSGRCICGEQVKPSNDTFSCLSCKKEYHLACMNLKDKNRYCAMCHLREIAPNKTVKKTIFMGVLNKNKKKHSFSIQMSEQDIKSAYLIQVRCFRLKQGTKSFILFPDYFKMTMGKQTLKEFLPIHKQSSLKYRKDESFILPNKDLFVNNKAKIVVSEKPLISCSKTDRIQLQNHLLGIFLIQQQSIQILLQQLLISSINTFEQSQKILLSAFQSSLGNQQLDDLLLLVVKIPLTCTLSTEKLKYPARGIFCTHNQCFDLYNFLVLTSQSTNPRWTCPFCRLPCFAFKIDCILLAILELNKDRNDIKEVMLFKTGEYTVSANSSEIQVSVNSIYNLVIPTRVKRSNSQIQEPAPQKRKQKIIEQMK